MTSEELSTKFDLAVPILIFEIILVGVWILINGFKGNEKEDLDQKTQQKNSIDPTQKLKVMLTQYEQLWTEIREYSKETWQIPSIVGVINSLLLPTAITLSNEETNLKLVVFPLLATAFLLTLTLTIALHKHHFFQAKAMSERDRIEKLLIEKYGAEQIYWGTKKVHNAIKRGDLKVKYVGWWTQRIAFKWLQGSMYIILALILIITFAVLPTYFS